MKKLQIALNLIEDFNKFVLKDNMITTEFVHSACLLAKLAKMETHAPHVLITKYYPIAL